MSTTTEASIEMESTTKQTATRQHIRGSSLLLVGRLLSLGINFAVQILIVRNLSKSDYGAFAYALALISLGSSLVVFGLDKTITRFVPIYQEHGDYNKLFGTIIMMVGTILSLGLALVLLVHGLQRLGAQSWINDQVAFDLLLILLILSPVQALGSLLESMFAVFASPKAIFFRRHLLGPGLKLSVVLLLVLGYGDVYFLASGYLIVGVLAVTIYIAILLHIMRTQNLFQYLNLRAIKYPIREVFSFSIPLLTSDFVFLLRGSLVIVLLEVFQSTTDVAAFRAVVPVARLNLIALQSFTFLYIPLASRMFAHKEGKGINDLYWQSSVWIAIISFPIFAITFALAQPLTLLLFGVDYTQSGIILALLSLGYYFHAALGFNNLTLKVFGRVRYIIVIDLLAVVISLSLNLSLIPRYGALGAAIGTCGTLIFHSIFYQAGLQRSTGIRLFQWRYIKFYLIIFLGTLGLLLIQIITSQSLYVGSVLAIIVSLLVIGLNRRALNIEQAFPELLRFPLLQRLLAIPKRGTS